MKNLIDEIMYGEDNLREEFKEEINWVKDEIATARLYLDELTIGKIDDLGEYLTDMEERYKPLNQDETYLIEVRKLDLLQLQSDLECQKEYEEYKKDPYAYYCISEKDFY